MLRTIDYSLFSYDVPDYAGRFYTETAPVFDCARPFALYHEQRPGTAVLLIHGFSGYPGEVIRPAIDLYEAGFDCLAVRLPGHGTSADDFIRSGARVWIAAAQAACEDLMGRYEQVYLVGHSMGGAIAVILAARLKIGKAALIAPAIVLRGTVWPVRLLRPFVRRIPTGWQPNTDFDLYYEGAPRDDRAMGEQYWAYRYPGPVCELLDVMAIARKSAPEMDADALVLFGTQDISVDPVSAKIIGRLNRGLTTSVTIENGTHLLQYDKDYTVQAACVEECLKHFGTP